MEAGRPESQERQKAREANVLSFFVFFRIKIRTNANAKVTNAKVVCCFNTNF